MRNYAVLSIAVDESRIFVTKERAPYRICLEVYRPAEEIKYQKELTKHRSHELMDRLFFNKAKSLAKIVAQAEKQLSKPICVQQIHNKPLNSTINPKFNGSRKSLYDADGSRDNGSAIDEQDMRYVKPFNSVRADHP